MDQHDWTRERHEAGARCLAAAESYAALGWSALCLCPPDHVGVGKAHGKTCTSPGKAPFGTWKEYQDRRADAEELRRKFTRDLVGANVGVALGPVSGLVGIDVDGPAGALKLAELAGDDLPATLEFLTPGGGRRLLYRIPEGVTPRNTQEPLAKGEELRFLAKGRQTVMPPSRHVSGGVYAWVPGHSPWEATAADMPAWLVRELAATPPRPSAGPTRLAEGELIAEGGRNSSLASMGGAMRERGFSADAILAALRVVNAEQCDPPLGEGEVETISRSVGSYEPNPYAGVKVIRSPTQQTNGVNGKAPEARVDDRPGADKDPQLYHLPDLLRLILPAPRWAVPGLMSEGLSILAGKPKLGKSWMALNLGITIAAGGIALGHARVEPGAVLYLSLEDRLRRVQDRAKKLLAGMGCAASARMEIAVEYPRMDQGGLLHIDEWLRKTENPRLVVVDVWAKMRPAYKTQGSQYDQDYQYASAIKQLGDKYGVSVLALHHCKKAAAEDVVDEISGTLGLAGAADGLLVLTRSRSEAEGDLFITGRDVEERKLALRFDAQTFIWECLGNAAEHTESRFKADLIARFKANVGCILGTSELADMVHCDADRRGHLRVLLARMAEQGLIERIGPGRFRWPAQEPEGFAESPPA